MYYGHMSKSEIMKSSIPFLMEIYKHYSKRACENLGVASELENTDDSGNGYTRSSYARDSQLDASDYPINFKKLSDKEREDAIASYGSNDEFLALFRK